ncbi:MAG TPA: cellulose biosynthesis cyclic di-GMP-binding regulatory protein BcsB, partial [Pseudorhizobium sp.]|nr:cellulose biosynthesis cyclic di-GMP-binding regulatory protein BcsB [Pseudorhizobium sp.]
MIRRPLSKFIALVLLGHLFHGHAQAQPAPFDMSPERPAATEPVPRLPPPRAVTPRPAPEPPPPAAPPTEAPPAEEPIAPPPPPPAARQEPVRPHQPRPPRATEATTGTPTGTRRYIIPSQTLALTGEYSRSAWSIYLTAEQAEAGRAVVLSYQNAIVVAPEASALSLTINNRQIGEDRINSPNGQKLLRWTIPPGLLRAGKNDLEVTADQRHRTDCDIRSTYDLWTEVDGGGSFIELTGDSRQGNSAAETINAIGADAEGVTHFQMVVPSIGPMEQLAPLLRLSQGVAVMSGMPNPQFSFEQQIPPQNGGPGRLTIAVGTSAELSKVLPDLPAGAETGPVTALASSRDGNGPILILTGPTWSSVGSAIEAFIAPWLRSPALRRESMSTSLWSGANAPFVFGGEVLSFAQLGIRTTEFSGRRFRTGFDIAVPSDFYAGAYGEAVLLLDAAYDASVVGGSHLDVYVNGSIASTVPVTENGGGILSQSPIQVTMRHLRAGLNRIELEAVLLSDADTACAPGSSASAGPRFALFDTSSFHMPSYARIGQTPNLAALTGTGAPYSRQEEPTGFYLDRVDYDMLAAAANFFGKMAQVSGAPLTLEPVSAANAVGGRNAIYIGSAGQLQTNVLAQLNLAKDLAVTWNTSGGGEDASNHGASSLEAWRDRLEGGFFSQKITSFREWLRAKLDLT